MRYLAAKSDNGFFLMIEESHIDKRSHSNDMEGMLEHLIAYDNTIKAVVQLAAEMGDTLVIATADHETGGLQYNGESAAELSDAMLRRMCLSSSIPTSARCRTSSTTRRLPAFAAPTFSTRRHNGIKAGVSGRRKAARTLSNPTGNRRIFLSGVTKGAAAA